MSTQLHPIHLTVSHGSSSLNVSVTRLVKLAMPTVIASSTISRSPSFFLSRPRSHR